MDFYRIMERNAKNDSIVVYPDFYVGRSTDLMVRGKAFYAIWDAEAGLWSTDEYDVQRLIDADLLAYRDRLAQKTDSRIGVQLLGNFSSKSWREYRTYIGLAPDSSHPLDNNLTFSNTVVRKKDYVSKRLPYPLEEGPYEAFDEIIGTLYDPEERGKLEWAIGAIVSGDAKHIQKFCVLYGDPGGGKGTLLDIIKKLFEGYYTTFEAKALTSSSNAFSTEMFRGNPLVAIQSDGDLSKIEDNSKLNSIVSHEEIVINEKFKPSYSARVNSFLFMATNKPVKITDGKSGIIRRLIDIKPSGRKFTPDRYHALMAQIDFELGGIAAHCLEVYKAMGKNYYSAYRPTDMMLKTDVFYNFVEEHYDLFKEQNGVSLAQAYRLYKEYCTETLVEFKLPLYKFREELKNYFDDFCERGQIDGDRRRNYYSGFTLHKFYSTSVKPQEKTLAMAMDETDSIVDEILANCPAQYATANDVPGKRWADVHTVLSDIDTEKVHYVKPPENHIVIDFDLKGADGEKSVEQNLEAASRWPATYAEFSKGGSGVHLHYIYDGDVSALGRVFSEGVEVKVFTGNSSLRRRLSKCNGVPVARINSGLPLKEKKPVLNEAVVKSERSLREQVLRNLRKEVHPGTKPSMDFIKKILDDAYESGLTYDLSDLMQDVLVFAASSTNQAQYCLNLMSQFKFMSEEGSTDKAEYGEDALVFYDLEVFPNLFVVSWMYDRDDAQVVTMINPTVEEVEELVKKRLVGFFNRQYDNHILYGRMMGYSLFQLYELSQKLINGGDRKAGKFREAYALSHADVYDFSSKKQGLKKFEIELGITHHELGMEWDQPVPEELWPLVGEYCADDVRATRATFYARKEDYVARQILAELSGLTVNDSTQQHTAKIIFGEDKNPQSSFVYTDLSEMFPGYKFSWGKSEYRGEDPGEGGYVYAEPGIHHNVALLDVASMHPTSIELLNAFGPYTKNFTDLLRARIAIKNKAFDEARGMLGGILEKHLTNEESADALSYALKIIVNIVYGLTSAKFQNMFKDPRNIDNIVAKRGALFMIDLKHEVQARGFTVAHIKTDSIKIPDATPEIIEFVMEFGRKYGYTFEHEATYEKMCLVNDAVYIAKVGWAQKESKIGTWEATGAQFAEPYVYKTLFSHEPIVFDDLCETKTVTTALYLDMNEALGEDEHDYHFVGRAGRFCPVKEGSGGGVLLRKKDDKYYAAVGTKGYRWMEADVLKTLGREGDVDHGYHRSLVDKAISTIAKFGDFEQFSQ